MGRRVGPEFSRGEVRLIVVNSDPSARDLMVGRLSAEPDFGVVAVAGTVAEAVAVAVSSRVDVIVTEATLADGSGEEICRQLQADDSCRCGCVVLTGIPIEASVDVVSEVNAFVLKELVGGTLQGEIRRVANAVGTRSPV